jgi:hypothetical protein
VLHNVVAHVKCARNYQQKRGSGQFCPILVFVITVESNGICGLKWSLFFVYKLKNYKKIKGFKMFGKPFLSPI